MMLCSFARLRKYIYGVLIPPMMRISDISYFAAGRLIAPSTAFVMILITPIDPLEAFVFYCDVINVTIVV
jgi:hypothetical protein